MDIFKISKSETRKKILQLFFADPGKEYYLRELERILHIPVGNIRRELLSLKKMGFFKIEKMGKQIYYSLDKGVPIFDEIKKIISKTIGAEAEIKKELDKIAGVKAAFIYGSFAKGREDQFSDIDLMIVGNPNENILISKVASVETKLKRELNYNIFSPEDLKKGLKKKEVFLEEIINNPKMFIIGNENDLEKIIRRK